MAGSVKDLAVYRFECASENLETAKELVLECVEDFLEQNGVNLGP